MSKIKIELERSDAAALRDLLGLINYHTTAAIMTLSSGDKFILDDDIKFANDAVVHTFARLSAALEK